MWPLVEGETLVTLRAVAPDTAVFDCVFGMGYIEHRWTWRGLIITERITAQAGDDPVLISATRIENTRNETTDVTIAEYWGVQPYRLTVAPIYRGMLKRVFDLIKSLAPTE